MALSESACISSRSAMPGQMVSGDRACCRLWLRPHCILLQLLWWMLQQVKLLPCLCEDAAVQNLEDSPLLKSEIFMQRSRAMQVP